MLLLVLLILLLVYDSMNMKVYEWDGCPDCLPDVKALDCDLADVKSCLFTSMRMSSVL